MLDEGYIGCDVAAPGESAESLKLLGESKANRRSFKEHPIHEGTQLGFVMRYFRTDRDPS